MKSRIENLAEKKLIGKRMIMSLSDNKTDELWRGFMQARKEIKNSLGTDLYSMQVYGHLYFNEFNPDIKFEKWAAIEVTNFEAVPDDMEIFTMPSGLYAVFLHRGAAHTGDKTFQYIFGTWLPNTEYSLDDRPHFEILRESYRNNDPGSEEEIWIPIKLKK